MKNLLKSKLLRFLLPIMLVVGMLGFAVPVSAATSNTITITGTAAFVTITTNNSTWTINGLTGSGYMNTSTTYYSNPAGDTIAPASTVLQASCYFDTTNGGNIPIDLTVNVPNFTSGDAMTNGSGTPGANAFAAFGYFQGETGFPGSKVTLAATGSGVLISNLAAAGNKYWGIMIQTQTGAWASAVAETSSCTIAATPH
jgi:hypothetical protein